MKKIKIESEFKIPGTEVVLEKGDLVLVKEANPTEAVQTLLSLSVTSVPQGAGLFYIRIGEINPYRLNAKPEELASGLFDEDDLRKYAAAKTKFVNEVMNLLEK